MRAALRLLAQAPVDGRGRRIAVLGDMLELGAESAALHRALAPEIAALGIDLVFCCGPSMRALWEVLPPARRGAHAPDAAALQPQVIGAVQGGDAIMVKGSLGSRMRPLVQALAALSSSSYQGRAGAPAQG
jgi:UDP-N-acetylmuramoyl-tripeptide--D-alanyl-D-alanine ligase